MQTTDEWVNEVRLVGKVSGKVDERELPSGDFVAALRLVVPRQPGHGRGTATVDTIDVACWTGAHPAECATAVRRRPGRGRGFAAPQVLPGRRRHRQQV